MIGSDSPQSGGTLRAAWPGWQFIVLVLLLAFPSSGFMQKHGGLAGVVGYVAVVAVVLYSLWRFGACVAPWLGRYFGGLSVLLVAGLAVGFAMVHPIEDGRGIGRSSDRDDALNLAVTRMADGQSPYYPSDKFAGPLSVLPGAVVLAAPFVALGNSGYQNLFWLAAFLVAAWWWCRDRALALCLLSVPLALSPAALYEYVSGGDLLANGIYVAVFFLSALRAWSNPRGGRWSSWLACVLLGLGLASRPNFLLLMPLFGAVLWRTVGLRQAAVAAGLVVMVSVALTLPFYLHDPAGFTPLLARGKLAIIDHVMPSASMVMIGVTAGLAVFGGCWMWLFPAAELQRSFFRWSTAVTMCPMVCAVALATVWSGHLDFGFMGDRFGLMYVPFALLGWGGQWLLGCESLRIGAGKEPTA
jgi:hypothetical protein